MPSKAQQLYRTVTGRRVRIICTDRKSPRVSGRRMPIVALVENDGRPEDMVVEYYDDGTHPFNSTLDINW